MKKIKFLSIMAAAAIAVGCSQIDSDMESGGAVRLESVGVEVAGITTKANQADPTMSTVAERAADGHVLTIGIAGTEAQYKYEKGRWIPDGEAAEFPGYGKANIALRLSKPGTSQQDGSAEGLLAADVVSCTAEVSPASELHGLQLMHAKTLVQVELDEKLTLDDNTDLKINDAVAYKVPGLTSYQAIVEPGSEGFNITLIRDAVTYVIFISREQTVGGEFLANHRYRLALTNVGKEVMLHAMVVEEWGESGAGAGVAIVETTISLGSNYVQGTPVKVMHVSGLEYTLDFTGQSDLSIGKVTGLEGDIVRSISIGGKPEILIGRATGETITLAVKADGSGIANLRQNSSSQYLVGTFAELAMADGPGMQEASILQEADIHLMDIAWRPLFDHEATPSANALKGTFDGGGKKIYGLKFDGGLGALIRATEQGTVKNVNVVSGSVGMGDEYINIAGVCAVNFGGTIENCSNGATIMGHSWLGGVCALNYGVIKNCTNRGAVISTGTYPAANAGGIVAFNEERSYGDVRVEGCVNEGRVTAKSYYTGGIIGVNQYAGAVISGCVNKGEVASVSYYGGGMAGASAGPITGCRNEGHIKSDGQSGGICGMIQQGVDVTDCVNTGRVESSGIGSAGGIVANNGSGDLARIINCHNSGHVTGTSAAGGITGWNGSGEVIASANTGVVESTGEYAGGIIGDNSGTIIACYSISDKIQARNYVGGLCGFNNKSVTASYAVTGTLSATAAGAVVGGLVSRNGSAGTISDSYWANYDKGVTQNENTDAAQVTVYQFASGVWPGDDAAKSWGVGNDYENGKYWNALGQYDATNPVYPELYWKANATPNPAPGRHAAISARSADSGLKATPAPYANRISDMK